MNADRLLNLTVPRCVVNSKDGNLKLKIETNRGVVLYKSTGLSVVYLHEAITTAAENVLLWVTETEKKEMDKIEGMATNPV